MHRLEIHSYPSRSYRDPESLEDVWIKIPVRYCAKAKILGLQYTKRLLPDFLIPGARMRLEAVIEAGRRKESGSSIEECCRIIGCNDLRTVRRHLGRLGEATKTAALTLAESQAASVHLHENSYRLRPRTPLKRLEELLGRQEEGQLRAGDNWRRPLTLRSLLQAVLRKNRSKVPTSYVCRPPPGRDRTSEKPSGGENGKDRLERH